MLVAHLLHAQMELSSVAVPQLDNAVYIWTIDSPRYGGRDPDTTQERPSSDQTSGTLPKPRGCPPSVFFSKRREFLNSITSSKLKVLELFFFIFALFFHPLTNSTTYFIRSMPELGPRVPLP